MSRRALTILAWGARAIASFLVLLALIVTARVLASGGARYLAERGIGALYGAWPTLVVLTVLIALSELASPAQHRRALGIAALAGWVASGLIYLSRERPSFSPWDIAAVAIAAGIPVLSLTLTLAATRRWSWRILPRLVTSVALGALLAWLVEPTLIVLACALAGKCL
jgi:hypothetical protein